MTTDERLRDAYQRAVESRAAAGRPGCPSAEALLALVRREGREADRLATLEHAMACAECRAEFELLRAIERAGGAGTREAVARIRWRREVSLALAASAVLAVALGPGRRLWDRGADEVMRSAPNADVVLVAPDASETLRADAPLTFTWRAVPGARGYTLDMLSADGAVAVSRETADTALSLARPATLAPGEYYWTVRARGEDGVERRSDARRLRLAE